MPPRLQAVFYRALDGSEPVDDFIESLKDPVKQAAIDNQIDRLNLVTPSNPHLPFPHSSQVSGELRELRCHYGSELYRVLYRAADAVLGREHCTADHRPLRPLPTLFRGSWCRTPRPGRRR
jgi:putative component of toxin-antitoxin plasmid stabilization module